MLRRVLLTLLGCWSAGVWSQTPDRPLLPTQVSPAHSPVWVLPASDATLPRNGADLDQWLGALQPRIGQRDSRLRGFVREESNLARDALCRDPSALTGPWGGLAELCLGNLLESSGGDPFGALQAGLTFGRNLEDIGWLDVSFGLGWLRSYQVPNPSGIDLLVNGQAHGHSSMVPPMIADPAFWPRLEGRTLSLSGQLWLSERSWLRVSGNHVRLSADNSAQWLYPQSWTSSSVSVDAGYGAFAGSVVGHRNRAPWRSDGLFDVDLGISWRTPWAGKLTVGARNVLNSAEQTLQKNAEPENPLLQARTPYVRYQQDL